MTIADASNTVANGISTGIDFIFFWKNWDQFSKFMLIGIVCFVIAMYLMFQHEFNKASKQSNRRFTNRRR